MQNIKPNGEVQVDNLEVGFLTARYSVPEDRFNYAKNIILKKYDNNAKGHLNFAEFTRMNIDLNGDRPSDDNCQHCL